MPIVTVHILKGRSAEIKRRLATSLTAAISDVLDVQPQSVQVLIEEYERESWSIGGELFSDRQSALKTPEVDLDALFRKPASEKAKVAVKPAAKAPSRKAPAKSRPRR